MLSETLHLEFQNVWCRECGMWRSNNS